SVASNTRVFTSKEKPRFWVTATGAIESTIKIYKRDLVDFIKSEAVKQAGVEISSDLSLYTSYNKKFHNPYSDSNPFLQLKKTLTPSYSDSRRADFKFDEHFEPGDYVVIAEAMDLSGSKRTSAIWWFSVTDLGLVVKHAPDQTLVRAIDLNTLKPVKGVSIDLFERDNGSPMNSLASSKTGPDGLCLIDLKKLGAKRSTYNPIVIGKNDIYTAYGAAGYWEGRQKHYSTYFYSDRPVYRLGQTVHYKAIVRELTSDGFKSADTASAVQVIIEDPDNSKLFDTTLYTSPHGTINGEFNIPESGKTGGYQISFNYPDGSSSYQSIEVAQYRKPEYKVEVLPLVNRIEAGSKLKAKVRATYFFGAPVANARVKYSVFSSTDWSTRYNLEPRPDYYSFYDSWSDQSYEYDYGGNLIAEGFAQTGETGEAEIEVETKPITSERHSPWFYNDYQDRTYKIEAEVTDISRLAVTASGSSIVSSGDYVVFVNPRSWVIQVGEAISTDIQVMDYQGKPVANKEVEVTLSRWPWDAVKHDHTEEKILIKQSVSTDASGKAQLSFATNKQWPTDTFYISAIVKDAHGHISCDGNSVWVASGNQPYYLTGNNLDKEAFKITLDKKVYQPGDTARVMISGPFKGNEGYEALVSVEGTRIHDYRIVALSASANLVEIPVKSGYAPNVYVSVTMVAPKKQFYFQTQAILVSPEQHFINLAIETDKEKYKPGETVTYKIKATNKNKKPVGNVELSLAVVDESIYSIRADSTPDIKKFFFRKRENWVSTSSSFPEQYSGGPDKIDPKLRKNFKDTAAWIPQLFTDSNGEASARI
ncbi:MAG: hypothetical protein K8F91_16350, partial [Candidatus Obscuribacterales bacterium]|nr:hypothetical protein [Candidatus Obscuribacterales bacterium]